MTTAASRVPSEWRAFFRFLSRPVLPGRADIALGGTARALAPLFALDMLLMVGVLGAIGLAIALGFEMPDHLMSGMELTPAVIGLIVIGAPLGEEILFRGWLSGRPGHVLAVLAILAGGVAFTIGAGGTLFVVGFAMGLLVAGAVVFALRKRDAMGWFRRSFAFWFYLSAMVFAAIHLTNFASAGASPVLLALVIPQFVLGLLLGYLRVHRGLMAGVALHMLHNALFAAVMIAGSS